MSRVQQRMQNWKRLFSSKNTLLWALFAILLAVFILYLFLAKDYGLSYDEILYYQYGDVNLDAIEKSIYGLPFDSFFNFYDLKYYGSAYLIIGKILINLAKAVFTSLDIYAAWHALNFLVFLIGAWFIFLLSKRFTSEKAALFASLLYLTQPLLWGHGVMNPKDTPFMISFLAAVTSGVVAVEKICAYNDSSRSQAPVRKLSMPNNYQKVWGGITAGILTIIGFDRISGNLLSLPMLTRGFTWVEASTNPLLAQAHTRLVNGISNGIPLLTYVNKLLQLVNLVEFVILGLVLIAGLIYALTSIPSVYRWVILSASLLGLTSSIRVLGPTAGGLVILYAFVFLRKRPLRYLVLYLCAAVVVMYITWPYLWLNPIGRFVECFQVMRNFPWGGSILFNGIEYLATDLPWYYLPGLISIQFSLPALLLAGFGTGLIIARWVKKQACWQKYTVLFAWFYLPVLLAILLRPTMYDNFRQFLFITPPMFLLAGIGFDQLSNWLKPAWLKTGVALCLLLPGIAAGLWLHPYEYVYYNGLVGWTGNITGRFENDYWATAMCDAANYLKRDTKIGVEVAFTDAIDSLMFEHCAPGHFQLLVERAVVSKITPEYSIIQTRYGDDRDYFRSMKVIKTVGRGNTAFLIIKSK